MTETDNTNPGGTLVLTVDDREHLIGELVRANATLEALVQAKGTGGYVTEDRARGYLQRMGANERLIKQLHELEA